MARRGHHSVYVVYLRNPKRDGNAGYYVGMTGLTPEQRFENHRKGIKAARVVRKFGVRLVPKLYAHLNPMPYRQAKDMEVMLADSLRKRGTPYTAGIEGGDESPPTWLTTRDGGCGLPVGGFAIEPIRAAAYLIRALVPLGLLRFVLYPRVPVIVLGHSSSQQPVRHHPPSDAECMRTPNG